MGLDFLNQITFDNMRGLVIQSTLYNLRQLVRSNLCIHRRMGKEVFKIKAEMYSNCCEPIYICYISNYFVQYGCCAARSGLFLNIPP